MPQMTGGQAMAAQLEREGVSIVFGLPGVQMYGALAAFRDSPNIRFITTRHEQATTFMADGYARAGGGIGAAFVVPGPGLLNAASGLSTAYSASSPVLVIAGQVERDKIGENTGALHEVNDQLEAIRPVTKWRRRALSAAEIPAVLHEAVVQLKSGRPRPVEIEAPPEALTETAEIELLDAAIAARPAAPAAGIERVAEMINRAERPVLFAGGGVHLSDAHTELRSLAEIAQTPVITSPEGKGALPDGHPLLAGATLSYEGPVRDLLWDADLILAVGTRLDRVSPRPEQQIVQIDIDPEEIGRVHERTVGLAGDARATLACLVDALGGGRRKRPSRAEAVKGVRADTLSSNLRAEPQHSILSALRAGTPDDAILVAGMTQIGYYSRPFWAVSEPRTYLTSSYSGNLGFAYPLALGAKVARPDRPVVSLSGDGGFMYHAQEISTAVKYGINVVAVVFNDNAFGNVARDMDEGFGGAFEADLANPDFMKLADAYGILGLRAKEPTDVGRLVGQAIAADEPALIEVPVGRMPRPAFFTRAQWARPGG